jgi:hypothetical protein
LFISHARTHAHPAPCILLSGSAEPPVRHSPGRVPGSYRGHRLCPEAPDRRVRRPLVCAFYHLASR